MLEFLFALYLVSGSLKGVMLAYGLHSPVDITLLTGVLLLLHALFGQGGEQWRERLKRLFRDRSSLFLGGFLIWVAISILFLTPSDDYAYWKGFAFLTNVVAFMVPLMEKDFRIRRFLGCFITYAILYGIFCFFLYAVNRMEILEVMGLETDSPLSVLYLKAGMILGVAGVLTFYLSKPWGFILLNLIIYLLLGTAARGPILFFFVALLAFGIHSGIRYIKKNGPGIRIRLRGYWLWPLFGFLLANLLVIGAIDRSELLRAPYERTWSRYQLLMERFGVGTEDVEVEEGASDASPVGSSHKEPSRASSSTSPSEPKPEGRAEQFVYVLEEVFKGPLPFTFGYGFGSYNLIVHGEDGRNYPHNVLLEIWFELGVIGLILALSFVCSLMIRMIQKGQLVLLFAAIFYFMNTMKSLSMVDVRLVFGLLAIGAFIHPPFPPRKEQQSGSELTEDRCSLFGSEKT